MASQPNTSPQEAVDIDATRDRLNALKAAEKLSWSDLGQRIGIPAGTLSPFATGTYGGDNGRIALQIARWFAAEAKRQEEDAIAPIDAPAFIETRAGRDVTNLLHWARRGKMVAVATSPGFGKTSALTQFQVDVPQVWVATMAPSTASVATMLAEVLEAMAEKDVRGSPQMLSRRVRERVLNSGGVIIIDDAQHLTAQALDELRGIHDMTKVGIALVGNAGLLQRLEGGTRAVAFAQLFSRVSMRIVQTTAYAEDGVAIGQAWGIDDPEMLDWLGALALKAGGLRTVSHVVELAHVVARGARRKPGFADLRDAWTTLSRRPVAA